MQPPKGLTPQLAEQLDCAGVAPGGECGHPTCGKDRHCAEELGELACGARIEAAIGAVGQAGDILEGLLDQTISTLLEHEGGRTETAEGACCAQDGIGAFLEGVAYEYERADLEQLGFLGGVGKDLFDLGFTGAAHHLRHDLGELTAIGHPAGGAALAEAAVIDQLEVEATDGSGGLEHLGLELTSGVPGRLPAGGGVEGEDEAAASGWYCRFGCGEFGQKFIDLGERWRALATACDVRHV